MLHHPFWNECFYGLLVTMKAILATVLLYFSPTTSDSGSVSLLSINFLIGKFLVVADSAESALACRRAHFPDCLSGI
ncbi:MAG: hypothetical protein R3C11_26630 [Planctomycetaceae bacterium]